jgi:hypothetical protein
MAGNEITVTRVRPPTRARRKTRMARGIDPEPRPRVEVLTEEDMENEEKLRPPPTPDKFFMTALHTETPQVPGAEIDAKVMRDMLSGLRLIDASEDESHAPIRYVKIKYAPDENKEARLFIEASGNNVWSAVALDVKARGLKGFVATIPLERTLAVLNLLADGHDKVVIGAGSDKFMVGPYSIPYGPLPEQMPLPPVMMDIDAQAVMPTECLNNICDAVAWARSFDLNHPALHGILLDFEMWTDSVTGEEMPILTAVGMNRFQMNILHLPPTMVRIKQGRPSSFEPETITVPVGFFRHLRALDDEGSASLEIGSKQIAAAGRDYMVIANAATTGLSDPSGMHGNLSNWRNADPGYTQHWVVDRSVMVEALEESLAVPDENWVEIEIQHANIMRLWCDGEIDYERNIKVQRVLGPRVEGVRINKEALLQALKSCKSASVKLGFSPELSKQSSKPMTLEDESIHYKSVIMPMTKE